MNKDSYILVTGANGMVGSALARKLRQDGFCNIWAPSREELNLLDEKKVAAEIWAWQPDHVFMIAAKVGGIKANISDPVAFLAENQRIQLNLFSACHQAKVQKSLFLGSSCVYPRSCPQPMKEEYLLGGPLEPTNEAYALAKISGLKLAQYYSRQFGMKTVCPMPCNIYGTGDHFNLDNAHVLSSLVRRFCDAAESGEETVTCWGTGITRREFIHVDDVVRAMLFLMETKDDSDPINVGTGADISIADLAAKIASASGFRGKTLWDPSKPDGMPKKCVDVSRLRNLGFVAEVGLDEGISRTTEEYLSLKKAGEIK